MKCLIIAAGQGTRLRARAPSKPLAEIGGAPLIEHVVRLAKAGGAPGFVVVTGYRPEPLEALLPDLAERAGAPIEAVRNPDWLQPNGVSVLAAAGRLGSRFGLLMSDHLFDPQILRRLIAGHDRAAALSLACDYRTDDPRLDLDDATKVEVGGGGRIVRIGKTLAGYDAVDTGIFVATPALHDALRAAIGAGGSGSLSEGVQRLADAGSAEAFDIGAGWWVDVDDETGFRRAEAELPGALAALG